MSNFLWDLLTLPFPKSNGKASRNPPTEAGAAEWNGVMQDLEDVRTAYLAGEMRPNPQGTTAVSSSGTARRRVSANGYFQRSENGAAFKPEWATEVLTHAASAGAWTPAPTEHAHAEVTMDADLTLNVPVPTEGAALVGGVRLEVRFTQDSTGFRWLTLHSSIVGGSRFQIRQGPGQVSTLSLRRSASGTWYVHAFDGIDLKKDLWTADFGADPTNSVDSHPAIQGAIDTSIYRCGFGIHPRVRIEEGNFRMDDTMHVGYGGADGVVLRCVRVKGSGMGPPGGYGGTTLTVTFSDRPAINVQGGRSSSVSDLAVDGLLTDWIADNHLTESADVDGQVDPSIDDTDPANWVDPGLAATHDGRYNPYCGLSTDAYNGTAPVSLGDRYPAVTFPSYSGLSGQYNKAASSGTIFRNLYVRGFNTGFVTTPSGSDGNGDFPILDNVIFDSCKWGVSVSHTQCRNVSCKNVQFYRTYCMWTNRTHGLQRGKFGGTWTDCSVSSGIKLFDLGSMTIGGTFTAINFYAESFYRLGDYDESAGHVLPMTFINSEFNVGLQNPRRGVSANLMGPINQTVNVNFDHCSFGYFPSVAYFQTIGATFDECDFRSQERDAGTDKAYIALAHNTLCGGLVLGRGDMHTVRNTKFSLFNIDDVIAGGGSVVTSPGNVIVNEDYNAVHRPFCTPLYARTVRTRENSFRSMLYNPQGQAARAWDVASFASMSLSGRELTIHHTALTDGDADIGGMMPGDVLLDSVNGTVYFVHSRSTTTVIARAQNNYKLVSAVETVNAAPSVYLYGIVSRFYTPTFAIKGDISNSTAIITNVVRGDGYGGFLATDVKVGDRYFVDEFTDLPFYNSTSKVTAVTAPYAGTITLSGNGLRNETGHRLEWFLREAPANV